MDAMPELVRLPAVMRMTGLKRSTIYKLMKERQFPASVKLTKRAVGWRTAELGRWCEARQQSAPH